MALAHVSSQNNTGVNVVTTTVTFTPGGAGNLLIAGCQSGLQTADTSAGNVGPALQITDNNGNIWESASPQTSTITSHGAARIFYCRNCNAGATIVTLTCANGAGVPAACDIRLVIDEFSGHSSAPLDKMANSAGTGTSLSSGPVTTTTANQIIYGLLVAKAGGTATQGGSYTVSGSGQVVGEWKIVSSSSSYTADGTGTSGDWLAYIATFSDQVITPANITRVNGGGNSDNTTGTTAVFTYMPIVGSLLLISTWASAATGTITLADSNGNTIVPLAGPLAVAAIGHIRSFYIAAAKAGPTSFTATFASSSNSGIMVDEFAGSPHASALTIDQNSLNTTTSTTGGAFTSPSVTTTAAIEVIWGYAALEPGGLTLGAGPYVFGSQDGDGNITSYQIVSSIQTGTSAAFIDSAGTGQAEGAGIASFFVTPTTPPALIIPIICPIVEYHWLGGDFN